MSSNRSPFTTAELIRLPRNAYAYRNKFGVWGIRQDATSVETIVHRDNNQPLIPSDYYALPVDAVIVAEVVSRSFTVAQQIDKAYNG